MQAHTPNTTNPAGLGNAAWPGAHVGSAASLGRGAFDRSLNDRDGGATWAPEHTYQGALQAHAGTLGASK
jgi:hypothetical protein